MAENNTYTLEQIQALLANLDNQSTDMSKGEMDMPKRIRELVTVNGKSKWVTGYTFQEVCESYVKLLVSEGLVEWVDNDDGIPLFGEYLKTFYSTYKQKQQANTVINRDRIIRNHVLPSFGTRRIDRIRTTDLQKYFNSLDAKYSKETLLKIRNIMSPVFDAAVEDDLIARNPFLSRHFEIGGRETVHHKANPREKRNAMKETLPSVEGRVRLMAALLLYTGMRFEEVLGLRWEDITDEWITVSRAVVHPTRNLPVVKCPKTKTSERRIPLAEPLKELLTPKYKSGFILFSDRSPKRDSPLSYTEARRVFDKIRRQFGLEKYTAHDFRDTCATEWRENGMSLDLIARLLGHAKTETTERRYVKYRADIMTGAREMM